MKKIILLLLSIVLMGCISVDGKDIKLVMGNKNQVDELLYMSDNEILFIKKITNTTEVDQGILVDAVLKAVKP